MNNQVILEAAIEAAAELILQGDVGNCVCRRSPNDKHDVNPPCSTRRRAIRTARSALEAAAPRIRAQALEDAADDIMKLDRGWGQWLLRRSATFEAIK